MRILVSTLLATLACAPLANADSHNERRKPSPDPGRLSLPHASLSLDVPEGWTATQFDGSIVDLRKDGARLWVYRGEKNDNPSERIARLMPRLKSRARFEGWKALGSSDAARVWYDTETEHRCLGALARKNGSSLSVEALIPLGKKALQADVHRICDSFVVTPFAHKRRVVHWPQKWTLDRNRFWMVGEAQGDLLQLKRGGLFGGFDLYVGRTKGQALEQLMRRRAFQDVQILFKPPQSKDGATETALILQPKKADEPVRHGWLRAAGELEAVLIHPDLSSEKGLQGAVDQDVAMLRTLREGTDPGPQDADTQSLTRTRFPRKGGPPLTFNLPSGWAIGEPSNQMRLADIRVSGKPALIGAAYWFGKGQGGTVESNIARWAGQFGQPAPTLKPVRFAPRMQATTLDLSNDDKRMLATILEIPSGKVFFKFVGDKAAMDKMAPAYQTWVRSFLWEGK